MNEMREQWLDHGISDIDYIRYLEKQINAMQEHKTCDGCSYLDNDGDCTCPLVCIRNPQDDDIKDYYEPNPT